MDPEKQNKVDDFASKINEAAENQVVECTLTTSERVLKRVTDGIYRQPASALRELISNAYDADATLVEVQTDYPRFNRITIRDNGSGLTPETLSYLIHNIGGSSKRTSDGAAMGVCNEDDQSRSPGGRKLVGKIGIGLFSVSQLTKEFQIITKTKGSNFRTIADVVLHTHSEDTMIKPAPEFSTGTVGIWKVPAEDIDHHGTEIILRNLLPKTVDDLTSKGMWARCNPEEMDDVISVPTQPPVYHIGCIHKNIPNEIGEAPSLPWDVSDTPRERFQKLVKGMYDLRGKENRNPSIYDHLDYYLRMIWILSLSAPIDYVESHPFDIGDEEDIRVFKLGNNRGDQATELSLSSGKTIRDEMGLVSPDRNDLPEFRVLIDGVELLRPIPFLDLPKTLESVPYSLLFVGKDSPDLSIYPEEVQGGSLEFEGYLLWNHAIVPKEHAGILVRISDSNGVLFDNTFMQYPVSEQRRKTQVTAEIYVTKGLDAALNIDRESFNYSHPHYQYITHWVHNAFRQFATKHKNIAQSIRVKARETETQKELGRIHQETENSLRSIIHDVDAPLPTVEFVDDPDVQAEQRTKGILSFERSTVFETKTKKSKSTRGKVVDSKFEEQIRSVAKILDAHGVFSDMSYDQQQKLLHDIVAIFTD